jgi:hypothetical protein
VSRLKDELHRLVDALPEEEIPAARRFLEWLIAEADGETLTAEEIAEAEAGWQDYLAGRSKPLEQVLQEQLHDRAD